MGRDALEMVEHEDASIVSVKRRIAERLGLGEQDLKILLWGSELADSSNLADSKVGLRR